MNGRAFQKIPRRLIRNAPIHRGSRLQHVRVCSTSEYAARLVRVRSTALRRVWVCWRILRQRSAVVIDLFRHWLILRCSRSSQRAGQRAGGLPRVLWAVVGPAGASWR